MKKLLSRLILAVVFSAVCLIGASEAFAAQAHIAKGNQPCSVAKFKTLKKYKGDAWDKVFSDPQVAPVLRAALKTDFKTLKTNLAQVDYPDSMSFVDDSGVLTLEGGVQGLFTIMEAKLIIEPCGNIYAAILDNGKRILYYTNDRSAAGNLPPSIEAWRVRLEERRGQDKTDKPAELAVVYKNK